MGHTGRLNKTHMNNYPTAMLLCWALLPSTPSPLSPSWHHLARQSGGASGAGGQSHHMGPAACSSHAPAPPICIHSLPQPVPRELCKQTQSQAASLEGTLVCCSWICPPCIPAQDPPDTQPADGNMALRSKSQLSHFLAVQPQASVFTSLSLGLPI